MSENRLVMNSDGKLGVMTTMCSNRLRPGDNSFEACTDWYSPRSYPRLAAEAKELGETHARYLAYVKGRRSFDPVRGDAPEPDEHLVRAVANLDGQL
jgi:hypothetical protein